MSKEGDRYGYYQERPDGSTPEPIPKNETPTPLTEFRAPDITKEWLERKLDEAPDTTASAGSAPAAPEPGLAEELEKCKIVECEVGTAKGGYPVSVIVPTDLFFRVTAALARRDALLHRISMNFHRIEVGGGSLTDDEDNLWADITAELG